MWQSYNLNLPSLEPQSDKLLTVLWSPAEDANLISCILKAKKCFLDQQINICCHGNYKHTFKVIFCTAVSNSGSETCNNWVADMVAVVIVTAKSNKNTCLKQRQWPANVKFPNLHPRAKISVQAKLFWLSFYSI